MNVEQLANWLQQHLPRYSAIQLPPGRIQVNHVLNWGGFVNHSFSIADDSHRYHLKITDDPGHQVRLQIWRELHEALEQRYRTPKLLEWLDLSEIGFAGFLAEHVEGRTARFCDNLDLVKQIADLVEARVVPSKAEEVQRLKRRRHEKALARYAAAWPA
jgi:hypothetical protein